MIKCFRNALLAALAVAATPVFAYDCADVGYFINLVETSQGIRMGTVERHPLKSWAARRGGYSAYAEYCEGDYQRVLGMTNILSPDKAQILGHLRDEIANARCWAALCEGRSSANRDHPMCN